MRKKLLDEMNEDAELINLTPLIDVLFTVLVLFIVISPFLDIESVQLPPKGSEATGQRNKRKIRIFVNKNEQIKINDTQVSLKQLSAVLIELKKTFQNEIPELYQDKNSPFGTYLNIKHALEQAGFEEMDLVVQPEG
ncbi:MAG: biopolymer transporter ExbD [Chlamydiae bacterium]|nr:biopolymer transporter ExbD [Chlamydiota bacterium]